MTILDIENDVQAHDIVRHPFLMKLKRGEYTKKQLQVRASQQFYFSTQFPRCLGALRCRISDYTVSLPLIKFLTIEHWGSEQEGAHWKLYSQVLAYFGMTIDELKDTPPLQETSDYLDYRFNLCISASVEEGLGCMGFAHELVNEKIFDSYRQWMAVLPDITTSALAYFQAHVEDEPEDYTVFKHIIGTYVKDDIGMHLVKKGAMETLEARSIFFDRIQARLEKMG